MSTIINPACKCINKKCKNHGNCKACQASHKAQPLNNQSYCQAGPVKFVARGLVEKLHF